MKDEMHKKGQFCFRRLRINYKIILLLLPIARGRKLNFCKEAENVKRSGRQQESSSDVRSTFEFSMTLSMQSKYDSSLTASVGFSSIPFTDCTETQLSHKHRNHTLEQHISARCHMTCCHMCRPHTKMKSLFYNFLNYQLFQVIFFLIVLVTWVVRVDSKLVLHCYPCHHEVVSELKKGHPHQAR